MRQDPSPQAPTATVRGIRLAISLVAAGLLVQLFAILFFTPGTFVVSASVGVPLVLAGAAWFFKTVWRVLRDKGAV